MVAKALGRIDWEMSVDDDGAREYKLTTLVESSYNDGPGAVLHASGLPAIGSQWIFGTDNDPWAFCLPAARVRQFRHRQEKHRFWQVEQTFSTLSGQRCQNQNIENPLAEPPAISGSFVRFKKKLERDRNGKLILNSSHEPVSGLEIDANRPTVIIEKNFPTLDLPIFSQMVNGLNDSLLWGLPPRCVMLADVQWERKRYGVCTFYYTRRYEFEIKYEGFDIDDVADAGFKEFDKLPGHSKDNPEHYRLIKFYGDQTPVKCLLNGEGERLTDPTQPIFLPKIEAVPQYNFYSLGIPVSLA